MQVVGEKKKKKSNGTNLVTVDNLVQNTQLSNSKSLNCNLENQLEKTKKKNSRFAKNQKTSQKNNVSAIPRLTAP